MANRNDLAHLEAIWTKRAHRGPMDPTDSAALSPEDGLIGSVDRSRRRQVTILDADSWASATAEAGGEADPAARRANFLVRGIDLEASRGKTLRIGEDVRIAIGGETLPCERMEEALPGLQNALRPHWRAGAFGRVVTGGEVKVGDPVAWESDPDADR